MSAQGLARAVSDMARRKVLGRLLALNHARYAEEERRGLNDKGARKTQSMGAVKGRRAKVAVGQVALFGDWYGRYQASSSRGSRVWHRVLGEP